MFLSTSVLNNLMKKAYKTGLVVARTQDAQGNDWLEYVTTEGATFHWMKQKGIPCERTYFYEVRRYFYYLMAKRI